MLESVRDLNSLTTEDQVPTFSTDCENEGSLIKKDEDTDCSTICNSTFENLTGDGAQATVLYAYDSPLCLIDTNVVANDYTGSSLVPTMKASLDSAVYIENSLFDRNKASQSTAFSITRASSVKVFKSTFTDNYAYRQVGVMDVDQDC